MLEEKKKEFIEELNQRVEDKILNKANADFLAKLIGKADSLEEVQAIMAMGTTYKRTGFHFDFRKEPVCGYTGIIGDICPKCGRDVREPISQREINAIRKRFGITTPFNLSCSCCE